VAADISRHEKYIVFCTRDKHLGLWETDNLSVISNQTYATIASKIRFVPSGRVIVLSINLGMSVVFQLRNLMRITSGTSVNATGHIGLTR
jgi:hypothetical protein